METQTKQTIAVLLALLSTWVYVGVDGMEPTHYCTSREIKAKCLELSSTGKTCYTLPSKTGGKRCSEGWEEIPFMPTIQIYSSEQEGTQFICNKDGCTKIK